MFYSQFILAKKGPLGTIWIAAHLERKLRKNQVADTDIGVSVDSILFPEVPIALRLSSHLLLGVVRIYSRKVNYLFHDCSEALLNIKQAFRSTAVDLPPEESSAPYHSITLPETFDLDDFELPDTALLNGNFVDHHVSTREQITLQDTLDGTGYSTSQFGLDERFGDGDASQIRLDLDEALFLDNNLSLQHASVPLASEEGAVHQGEVATSLTNMDIDEAQHVCDEDRNAGTSKDLSELLCNDRGKHVVSDAENLNRNDDFSHRLVFNVQTPDLNEMFFSDDHIGGPSAVPNDIAIDFAADDPPSPEFIESGQAPSTPGLLEEPIPANVQEIPASSQDKISPSTILEANKLGTSTTQEFECPDATNDSGLICVASTDSKLANLAQVVSSPTSVLTEPKPDSVAPQCSGGILAAPDATNDNGLIHVVSTDPRLENTAKVASCPTTVEPKLDSLAPQISGGILAAPDATNDNCLIHEVSTTDPKLANIVQVVSSSALVLTEPIPDSLAPQCSGRSLTAADVACLESTPKSADSTGFISNEASYLPISDQVHDKGEATLPEVAPLDCGISSFCFHDASNLRTPLAKAVVDPEAAVVTSNISTDNLLVSRVVSGINITSLDDTTGQSNLGNQGYVEDANSCPTSNLSAFSSDFHLRSCSSQLNRGNVLSLEDMVLIENAREFSFRDSGCNLETPVREKALHFSEYSVELPGEDSLSANVTETSIGVHQKSNYVISEFKSGVNNPEQLSSNCISKDAQLDHWNCFSSSEFSDPERMLLAPTGNVNLPIDLGQQTAEKGVTESDGTVDRISSLCGQKRRLMDSTPVLQNGISPKMSGIPRSRRNKEYIPDDDDLLASILVGRRTPALRMGPSPPLPKAASLKRSRLTPRVGMRKRRKVLLDDTIVLHADAIRQQLINTEDIRRMRKKAPCTHPEIWRIQKSLVEDDIFSESVFTGVSAELNSLHTQKYDLNHNLHSQINEHYSSMEISKEVELSRSSEFVKESGGREMVVQNAVMPDRVDGGMQGLSGTSVLIEEQSCKAAAIDAQEQLESPILPPQLEPSSNNQTSIISTVEVDVHESTGVELATRSASHFGNECEISTDSKFEEKHDDICINPERHSLTELVQTDELSEVNENLLHATECAAVEDFISAEDAAGGRVVDNIELAAMNDETSFRAEDACNAEAASIMEKDMSVDIVGAVNLDYPRDGHANAGQIGSDGASVSMLHSFILEVGADLPADSSTVIGYTNSSIPDVALVSGEITNMVITTDHQVMEESKAGEVAVGDEPLAEKVLVDEERPTSEVLCAERPHMASPFPVPPSTENERVPSAAGENSCIQEFNLEGGLVVESTPMDFAAARESTDFCSAIDDIDTEFLNVDDEVDYDEEADNDVPNPEEAQLPENSGWSSRTRGVARYLKTMFDEESGRGRKSVAIDHLLAGKTRKEASRMFFETLVLKTRDYIHVEQENPFNCINIKPRIKLLKSEF